MPTETTDDIDVINILSNLENHKRRNEPILKQVSKPPKRFHIPLMVVMAWCFWMLWISPMIMSWMPDPIAWARGLDSTWQAYTFQIPLVIFIAALLGPRYGTLTVCLYLALGLAGLPIFAGGGGLAYLKSPTAGYLLGFLLVPLVTRRMLARAYHSQGWFQGRSLWLLLAAAYAVGAVHICGLIGLIAHTANSPMTWEEALQWMTRLTWPGILYDFIFGFFAIGLVRLCRIGLWLCLY